MYSTVQKNAEREATTALRVESLSIMTHLEDRLQSQLQHMPYITSTVEVEIPLVPASSPPQQELSLLTRNIPRAICCTTWQIGRLFLPQPLVSLAILHMIIIVGLLCTLQHMDNWNQVQYRKNMIDGYSSM